jgi:hypothetical protein
MRPWLDHPDPGHGPSSPLPGEDDATAGYDDAHVRPMTVVPFQKGTAGIEVADVPARAGCDDPCMTQLTNPATHDHPNFVRANRLASAGPTEQVFLGGLFPGIIGSGGFTASAIPLR